MIMTGAAALQPGVLNDPASNPNTLQDQAAGIYNQGARAAYHQHLVTGKQAIFIDDHNNLENISVRYWLYPVELTGSRYGTDLPMALQHPEARTIIYVGPAGAYSHALPAMDPHMRATVVRAAGGDVFAVVRQQ
jgi:hypothetical protein